MSGFKLQFLQHNVNQQPEAQLSVLETALKNKVNIVFLQEPSFPQNPTTIRDFSLCFQHPSYIPVIPIPASDLSKIPGRPKVITYIRKTIGIEWNPQYNLALDPDFQIIEFFGLEPFLALHVYNEKVRRIPPNNSSGPTGPTVGPEAGPEAGPESGPETGPESGYTVDRIFPLCFTQPLLTVGDFNLHNEWWNPSFQGPPIARSLSFVTWLENHNATLLNDPEVITEFGGTFFRKKTFEIFRLSTLPLLLDSFERTGATGVTWKARDQITKLSALQ